MPERFEDHRVRLAAFQWLEEQVALHGDVLPRDLLAEGFRLEGERVPMLGPQGIFKPKVIPEIPLSITTTPAGPYEDVFSQDDLLLYRYRGEDPQHHENVGLRKAMTRQTPLVYFHGIVPGRYLAAWPVFVVGDEPRKLTFTVAVDDVRVAERLLRAQEATTPRGAGGLFEGIGEPSEDSTGVYVEPEAEGRRAYITATVKKRVHQRSFRERVLRAYREQCCLCRLRHQELLDAAHIVPDTEPAGEPNVRNGLALCKLHHAAFDNHFLGVRPDYVIEVRRDVLEEQDGPMLVHGLKGLHHQRVHVPRSETLAPDPALLEHRYARFRAQGARA